VFKVIVFDEAYEDISQAALYLEEHSSDLGRDFLHEFRKVADNIANFPEAHPCVKDDLRRCSIFRFRYNLFYRIKSSDTLEIIAVVHSKRKPYSFMDRL